jgi:hypothetical protein
LFATIFGKNDAKENGDILSLTLAGNHKVGFEDVLYIIKQNSEKEKRNRTKKNNNHTYWLVNTLPSTEQDVLIPHTISCQEEEEMVNHVLNDLSKNPHHYCIVIYGKHNTDDTVDKKYKQLMEIGFKHVFIYYGGLFEWTLLQDVYGSEHFPTTITRTPPNSNNIDLLHWAPGSKLRMKESRRSFDGT